MNQKKLIRRYPGVTPFSEEQQNIFFGRDSDIKKLYKLIKMRKQILLYAKSGIGKTSLLNAGVLPKLEDKYTIIKIRFFAYDDINSASPVTKVMNALHSKIKQEISEKSITDKKLKPEVPDILKNAEQSLWHVFKKLQYEGKERFILVFDQFEELFSYPNQQIEQFKDELQQLTSDDIPPDIKKQLAKIDDIDDNLFDIFYEDMSIKTVFAIRSDRLSLLNRLTDKIPDIQENFYELKPLNKEQTKQAIIKPAISKAELKTKAFTFENNALEKIINTLTQNGKQHVETTQLQIVCHKLEDIAQQKYLDTLKIDLVQIKQQDLPEFKDIFMSFYDETITSAVATSVIDTLNAIALRDETQKIRKFVEDQLIRNQQRISLDEIICLDYVSKEFLKKLVNKHLLRAERNSTGGFSYELSHDTLVEPIVEAKRIREKWELIEKIKLEKEQEIIKNKKEEEEKKLKETYNSVLIAKKTLNLLSLQDKKIEINFKQFVKFSKPNNLINGDFLFLKQFDDIIFLGLFDATGSGIPAAFLRLFGYSQLDKIVNNKNIEANEILFKLKKIVIDTFYSEENNNTEGFDGAICKIDFTNKILKYSGAKISLFQRSNNQILTHKADRICIDKNPFVEDDYMFKQKTINYLQNDWFYLTTDGYINQMRNKDFLKFSVKNFKKTLLKLQNNTIEKQIIIIENIHNIWKETQTQTDDIFIIGFLP